MLIFSGGMAAEEIRGPLGSRFPLFFAGAFYISYCVNYVVHDHVDPSMKQWQIPIGLQLVPEGFITARHVHGEGKRTLACETWKTRGSSYKLGMGTRRRFSRNLGRTRQDFKWTRSRVQNDRRRQLEKITLPGRRVDCYLPLLSSLGNK